MDSFIVVKGKMPRGFARAEIRVNPLNEWLQLCRDENGTSIASEKSRAVGEAVLGSEVWGTQKPRGFFEKLFSAKNHAPGINADLGEWIAHEIEGVEISVLPTSFGLHCKLGKDEFNIRRIFGNVFYEDPSMTTDVKDWNGTLIEVAKEGSNIDHFVDKLASSMTERFESFEERHNCQ